MKPSQSLSVSLLLLAPAVAGAADFSQSTQADQDRASVLEAFEAARRQAVATPGGFRLDNRASGVSLGLDGRGLAILAELDGATWGLELAAWGRPADLRPISGAAKAEPAGARVTYSWGADLDEWVVNDATGIEHGYTLRRAPARTADAPLVLDLDVRGGLTPRVTQDGTGVQFLGSDGQVDVTYTGLLAFDAAGRTLPAHLEPRGSELRLVVDDALAVYPVTIDPKIQLGYLKAQDPNSGDRMGDTVAIDGDTAVIGVPADKSAATGVYGNAFDNSATLAGAAYVFVRNGSTWTEQAFLKGSNTNGYDRFGTSVAIHGDRIAVGAPFEQSNATGVNGNQADTSLYHAGAAYVFYRFGLTWGQEAYIKATNTEANDSFGYSVAIEDNLLVVGARYEHGGSAGINGDQSDNSVWRSGAAYVYTRSGFNWTPALYLKASNPGDQDYFGESVAIDGNRIIVAAPGEDSAATGINGNQANDSAVSSGAVYVFELKGELWVQDAYIKASNTDIGDVFGRAIAIDGDTLVVGAPAESSSAAGVNSDQSDNSANWTGAAYVFVDDGSIWSQQAYLKASNAAAGDFFAQSVAVSGDRVVVGAPYEDSSTIGINNKKDNALMDAGAAYVFERTAGTWTETTFLKASNTGQNDSFGHAVAISGSTVIVGAPGEDGGETGNFADQSDDSQPSAGAAYAFELDSNWGVVQYGPETGTNVADMNAFTPPLVNSMFTLEMSEWTAPGIAFLMVSAGQTNVPILGGTLLVDPQLAFFGVNHVTALLVSTDKNSFSGYLPPNLSGKTIYAQAALLDLAQPEGFVFTNGLSISIP